MKKKPYNPLIALEYLRDFVEEIHSHEFYFKNLVIEGKENTNLRLWVLRKLLGLNEEKMSQILGISSEEYKRYEKMGNKVPDSILRKISRKFRVSLKWLKCKSPEWFPEIRKKNK